MNRISMAGLLGGLCLGALFCSKAHAETSDRRVADLNLAGDTTEASISLYDGWIKNGAAIGYRPSGWLWFSWPYAYDIASADWYWFHSANAQLVIGPWPTGNWLRMGNSALANGWTYFNWPYAYDWEEQGWYYMNSGDIQWCVNLRTGQWARFGLATASAGMARVPRTGQTASHRTGDDGNLQRGVAWPNPRFTDNGNGTVTDNLTGLMWVKAPHALPGNAAMNWSDAIDFCNALTYATRSDWRLPNSLELRSLLDASQHSPALPVGHPFTGVLNNNYWTSTTTPFNANEAWQILVSSGFMANLSKTSPYQVWPVRDGVGGTLVLPRTGQTTSHRAGDDGALQKGVAWPSPRFTDNGNGTVTDNLTGLTWVKAPHALPGNAAMKWSDAIDFCNALTYATRSDWRLPNERELRSLLDASQHSPALPAGHPFTGVLNNNYWTSTTPPFNANEAWQILVSSGFMANLSKTSLYQVWPVRGGP